MIPAIVLLKAELVSKERHNERATSRKTDKSKTVSTERQEYCQFELKIEFLMTKLTLILTLNDPKPDPQDNVALLIQYLCRSFIMSLFQSVALLNGFQSKCLCLCGGHS